MALSLAQQNEIAADLAALREKPHDSGGFVSVNRAGDLVAARGLIAGYVVLPHVQSYADELRKATAVKTIGTYPGHSPSIDRALDQFHRVGDDALADAICDFFLANWQRFGGRYIISRRFIWHRLDPVWRWMEDRGDNTQNHFDHVHASFEATAPGPFGPSPLPVPEPEPNPEPTPQPEPKKENPLMFLVSHGDQLYIVGVGHSGNALSWVDGPDHAAYIQRFGEPIPITTLTYESMLAPPK